MIEEITPELQERFKRMIEATKPLNELLIAELDKYDPRDKEQGIRLATLEKEINRLEREVFPELQEF